VDVHFSLLLSQLLDVELIVTAVHADEFDPGDLPREPELDDQPILIAADVEDDSGIRTRRTPF
jgi:hypothetical protein